MGATFDKLLGEVLLHKHKRSDITDALWDIVDGKLVPSEVQDVAINTDTLYVDTTNGRVGIGTDSPNTTLHIAGGATSDWIQSDAGINLDQVKVSGYGYIGVEVLEEAGNIGPGEYRYGFCFVTEQGETEMYQNNNAIYTFDATHGKATLTIPVSTDSRVIGRRIFRSKANESAGFYYSLVTINDNTTITYEDNVADADLGTVNEYRKSNTSNAQIRVSGKPAFFVDEYQTILGIQAGEDLTTGYGNTLIGYLAGADTTTGSSNTLIGLGANNRNKTGGGNTIIGYASGYYATGSNNVLMGNYAANAIFGAADLTYNTIIGNYAAYNALGTVGCNTILGYYAGRYLDGENNVFIGHQAGYNTTGVSNILIGYRAGYNETGSNKLYIANSSTSTPLIYGDFTAGLTIHSQATTATALTVKGIASQTGNLQEWQNSSGTKLSSIENDGSLQTGAKRIKSLETSTGTATVGDVEVHICNSATDYTLTLPAHEAGREIRIINKNSGTVTLTTPSGTIKGETTESLYEGEVLILISDGTDYL